jgi:hypothetical protein
MGDILPAFVVMLIFGAPVAAWIISRVLAHQERMAMIQRGFIPPNDPRMRNVPPPGYNMNPGAVPPPPIPQGYDDGGYYAQAGLRKGIMVTCIGLALFMGLSFIGVRGGSFYPGPWLLGGLIPMFVGIAQIISALLSGARFPQMGSGSHASSFGPPPSAGPRPSAPPPPPQQAGPYAWRPGSTPEIEPPHPPEKR